MPATPLTIPANGVVRLCKRIAVPSSLTSEVVYTSAVVSTATNVSLGMPIPNTRIPAMAVGTEKANIPVTSYAASLAIHAPAIAGTPKSLPIALDTTPLSLATPGIATLG